MHIDKEELPLFLYLGLLMLLGIGAIILVCMGYWPLKFILGGYFVACTCVLYAYMRTVPMEGVDIVLNYPNYKKWEVLVGTLKTSKIIVYKSQPGDNGMTIYRAFPFQSISNKWWMERIKIQAIRMLILIKCIK